ncbi:MAG TPA: 3-hydroxyacyl-CoA dehydrogenase NAD-binding domain-containing protein [Bryobacteraceae bacterium]|nr:3-hydroxyacyl-CoA dehydrogenase NAD-binding domain-containing protein [Bryobacteraceae bacterium]
MNTLVRYERDQDVAVITIDNPPVNALSPGVPEALTAAITQANADASVRAIVVIGAGRTFIAGADVNEFGKPTSAQYLASLLQAVRTVEDSAKPVVMAIHGSALGGGLETAMAGHYRVIAPAAQVGQPEVKLGLIPGAGGTWRLPRLAGVAKALEMCVFGAPIKAQDAFAAGIVDRIIDGDLRTGAVAFAREIADKPFRKTRDLNEKVANPDPAIFKTTLDQVHKKMRGQEAPQAAVVAVQAATTLSFEMHTHFESVGFADLLKGTQSKALIHAFFAERSVTKIPGISASTPTYEIRRAAIVGAGTMGGGIAMALANAAIPVTIKETTQEALDRGMANIRRNYARLPKEAADQKLALITPQLTFEGFDQADIIIEAVFENLAVKQQVFRDLDAIAKPSCILATNTSSLNIDQIASATHRPEMVIGLHFFSPANIMRLVEIVRGQATSPEVTATAAALTKKLGKIGVVAGNCPGFIGNRMINVYGREAQFLLEEGASVEEVNQALYDFGMPMGPLAMFDLVGNDVMRDIAEVSGAPPGARRPLVLPQLCAQGRLGQKTGKGWSRYDENRKPSPDPEVAALVESTARAAGIERRIIAQEEIVDRCVLALVNEGARILEEGMALRSSDIDVIYITGYGFPAWRGGPMFYAESLGPATVRARIEEFAQRHGRALWPANTARSESSPKSPESPR